MVSIGNSSRRGFRNGNAARLAIVSRVRLAGALGSVLLAWPAQSAQLGMTSTFPPTHLVGERGSFDLGITATGGEGPGDVSLTFVWDARRTLPNPLAAFVLQSLPSALSPGSSVSLDEDCQASVGAPEGRCGLTITLPQAVQSGWTPLVRFDFQYLWNPDPGYELCFGVGVDPTCLGANQDVLLLTLDSIVFGEPFGSIATSRGTFGMPGVRAIPEPSTAVLAGLGLALLSAGIDRRSAGKNALAFRDAACFRDP